MTDHDESSQMHEDGEQYAELARAVYAAAEKERWTNQQTFKMLNNPQEFIRYTEAVSADTDMGSVVLIYVVVSASSPSWLARGQSNERSGPHGSRC